VREREKRAAGAEPKGVCRGQECDRLVVKLCQASIAASAMISMVCLVDWLEWGGSGAFAVMMTEP
jgi:hypothetical protein